MTLLNEIADAFLQIWNSNTLAPDREFGVDRLSVNEAYDVQKSVLAHRVVQGDRVVGYKVGCTSHAIRQQFGLSEPICGRLLEPHVYQGETTLNWHDYVQCAVEPEFVLCIGRDVTGEIPNDEELLAAIDWVAPGIEVHNFKFWFNRPTLQELIASNGIHAGLVVGQRRMSPATLDMNLEDVGIFRNDKLAASGTGAEIMGGPLTSLRWLINHLLQRDEYLRSGQLVIPGSPVELVPVEPNDRITARLTNVGSVSATFAA